MNPVTRVGASILIPQNKLILASAPPVELRVRMVVPDEVVKEVERDLLQGRWTEGGEGGGWAAPHSIWVTCPDAKVILGSGRQTGQGVENEPTGLFPKLTEVRESILSAGKSMGMTRW